jgi:hypothetical protein
VEYCYFASNLLVEPGGNPDGSDKVHDQKVAVLLVENHLVFADGQWYDDGGFDLEVREGETACPAA